MSHGFIGIGFLLVTLLWAAGRLTSLHTRDFMQLLKQGKYDQANAMGKRGSWIFRLHMLTMGAVLWWLWQLFTILEVF